MKKDPLILLLQFIVFLLIYSHSLYASEKKPPANVKPKEETNTSKPSKEETAICINCEQYLPLVNAIKGAVSFASQISYMGLPSSGTGNSTFFNAQMQLQTQRKQIDDDPKIPLECKEWARKQLNIPVLHVVINVPSVIAQVQRQDGQVQALVALEVYQDIYKKHLGTFCPTPSDKSEKTYIKCLRENADKAFDTFLKDSSIMKDDILKTNYSLNTAQINSVKHYASLIHSKQNMENFIDDVKSKKIKLSRDEIDMLTTQLGYQFDVDYSRQRAGSISGDEAVGVVTEDQLMSAARNNSKFGIFSKNDKWAKDLKKDGGVCRDIHFFGRRLQEASGYNQHSLTIPYQNLDGRHEYGLVQRKSSKKAPPYLKIFNYGDTYEIGGTDGTSLLGLSGLDPLFDKMPTFYKVGKDYTVQNLNSEMGKFLTSVTGFSNTLWDPLPRETASYNSASLADGSLNNFKVNFYDGSDGEGTLYKGLALTEFHTANKKFPGQIGLTVANWEKPNIATNGHIFYIMGEQHAIAGFNSSPRTRWTFDTSLAANFAYHWGTVGVGHNGDSDAHNPNVSIMSSAKLDLGDRYRDKLRGSVELGVHSLLGNVDHRDTFFQLIIPVELYSHLAAEYKLTPDSILYFKGTATLDALGPRGKATLGVATQHLAALFECSGRLTDDGFIARDTALRRCGLNFVTRPNKVINIGVNFSTPVEPGTTEKPGVDLTFGIQK